MHTQTFTTRVIFHQPTFLCFSYFLLAYNYNKTGDLYVTCWTGEEVFFLSFYLFCFKNNSVLNLVRSSFHLTNAQAMNNFLQLPLYNIILFLLLFLFPYKVRIFILCLQRRTNLTKIFLNHAQSSIYIVLVDYKFYL